MIFEDKQFLFPRNNLKLLNFYTLIIIRTQNTRVLPRILPQRLIKNRHLI